MFRQNNGSLYPAHAHRVRQNYRTLKMYRGEVGLSGATC
jgi:hypothetical protein